MIAETGLAALWLAAALGLLQAGHALILARGGESLALAAIERIGVIRGMLALLALCALVLVFARTDLSVMLVADLSHAAWPLAERLTVVAETGEAALLAGSAIISLGAVWASKWALGWPTRARAILLLWEPLAGLAACAALLRWPHAFARLDPSAPEGLGRGLHLGGEAFALHLSLSTLGAALLIIALLLAASALPGAVSPGHRNRAIRPWAAAAWAALAPAFALAWTAGSGFGLLGVIAVCWMAASLLLLWSRGWSGLPGRSLAGFARPAALGGGALVFLCILLAQSRERETQVWLREEETAVFRPWSLTLRTVTPNAGSNWTAIEAAVSASWDRDQPAMIRPQARSYFAPQAQASTWAGANRWNGRLRVKLGGRQDRGRWQLTLVWQPFGQLIALGGLIAALAGLVLAAAHIAGLVRREAAQEKIAYRRMRQGR
jgi:cytochrome c biogenesis factor